MLDVMTLQWKFPMMIQEICISGGGDSEGAGRPGQCADKGVILREPERAG